MTTQKNNRCFCPRRCCQSKKPCAAGFLLCLIIAIAAACMGRHVPLIGGPVFALLLGMGITLLFRDRSALQPGISFASGKMLRYAVILLGFGLNLRAVLKTGKQSLPVIAATIFAALAAAALLQKLLRLPPRTATLIGTGSAICGGSAIAATAPVIQADDEEVAQSISVIFLFNIAAALLFPWLGSRIGFSASDADAFALFAGTAINDTSSVTAAASAWDSMYHLGSATLEKAVTVKLTRTLAIIPMTLFLAVSQSGKPGNTQAKTRPSRSFPFFVLAFFGACVITTIASGLGAPPELFTPFRSLSRFFILIAMAAIGLNTDIRTLLRTGGKPLLLGLGCWASVTLTSLGMQRLLGIW